MRRHHVLDAINLADGAGLHFDRADFFKTARGEAFREYHGNATLQQPILRRRVPRIELAIMPRPPQPCSRIAAAPVACRPMA